MPAEPPTGRRFISDIRRAVRAGKLRKRFSSRRREKGVSRVE